MKHTTNQPFLMRLSLFLMAILLALGCMASCGGKGNDKPQNTTNGDTTPEKPEQPTEDLDENGYLKDQLPAMNFDEEVNILCWNTAMVDEFGLDKKSEDHITSSFVNRNYTVEERAGVTLNYYPIDGNNANQTQFVSTAINEIFNGGTCAYDLIASYSMCGGSMAVKSALLDLMDQDYLMLSNPWWADNLVNLSKINNKLYFTSGDISGEILYNMMFLLYNTDIGEGLLMDDPREMVLNQTWTMDELYRRATNVYTDLNRDGVKSDGDQFGLIIATQVLIDGFFYGCGMTFTENSAGYISLTKDFTDVKTFDFLSRLNDFLHRTDYGLYTNSNASFKAGKALFGTAQAACFSSVKAAGWHYSLLPFPKYDLQQTDYYSALGFGYSNWSIPVSARNPGMSAYVMECLASESYRQTTPAIFETTFKSMYSEDPLDQTMFDIIRAGVVTDSARIFSSSFKWNQSCLGLLRNCVMNNTASSWTSDLKEEIPYINSIFTSILQEKNKPN